MHLFISIIADVSMEYLLRSSRDKAAVLTDCFLQHNAMAVKKGKRAELVVRMWHHGKELWAQFEVPPNSIKMQLPAPPMQMSSILKFHLFKKSSFIIGA